MDHTQLVAGTDTRIGHLLRSVAAIISVVQLNKIARVHRHVLCAREREGVSEEGREGREGWEANADE